MSWPCHEVSEFQDFLTHAQTVCTLLFPPPREARASPYAGKRGTGDEAKGVHVALERLCKCQTHSEASFSSATGSLLSFSCVFLGL